MGSDWRPRYTPAERFDRQLSLAVVGDMGGGKTTLSVRFTSGTFLSVVPTVGYDFHLRTVEAKDGRKIQVRIWDTAGQERHRAVVPVLFRGVHGCLLVYDCTSSQSFHNLPLWVEALSQMTRSPVTSVVVANKTDLGEVRAVLPDEGAAMARRLGAVKFLETSAKDGSNVDAAFIALVDAILATERDLKKESNVVALTDDEPTQRSSWCAGRCFF